MSTNGYLECKTHHPHAKSEEVGNFSYESSLQKVRDFLENRAEIVEAYETLAKHLGGWVDLTSDPRERALMYFLSKHPNCDIGIIDEYGRRYPLKEGGPLNHIIYTIVDKPLCKIVDVMPSDNPIAFQQDPSATACQVCTDIFKNWLISWF